jgi:hypothetical protein
VSTPSTPQKGGSPATPSADKPVFRPDADDPIVKLPDWTPEAREALSDDGLFTSPIPGLTEEILRKSDIVLRWIPIPGNDNAAKTSHLSPAERQMVAHCLAHPGAGGPVNREAFPTIPNFYCTPMAADPSKQRIHDTDQELWWFRRPVHHRFIHGEADAFHESFAAKAMDPNAAEYKKDKSLGTTPKGGMKPSGKSVDVTIN